MPNDAAIAGRECWLGAQAETCGRGSVRRAKGASAGRGKMTTVQASLLFRFRSWLLPLLAMLCACGMWTYVNRVMISHQISDAAAHGRPRGNLSDLYPHWIGARELLLNGRDPYRQEVTREIQEATNGAPL